MLQSAFQKYVLDFKFEAGTSRGVLTQKDTWFIKVWDSKNPAVYGLGEAGPLKKLSIDDIEDFEPRLREVLRVLEENDLPSTQEEVLGLVKTLVPEDLPSVAFALETALLDLLNGGKHLIFATPFFSSEEKIPINGLIWMGHTDSMLLQVSDKVAHDFDCVKMKIGSLNFEKECDILDFIRRKYYQKDIILRVDANGAFKPEEALDKLTNLAK